MADFVPGLQLTELMKRQLTCPRCSTFMKPPIYQCSSSHPICETCWEKEENCISCNEPYKKELLSDLYPGFKMYYYKCSIDRNCNEVINYQGLGQSKKSSVHVVHGSGKPYTFTCGTCKKPSFNLYPLNGVLISEEALMAAKQTFKPMRNLHLEMYTAFVLYPCDNEGCTERVLLSEKQAHGADCNRVISCAILDCPWKGSVNSIAEHLVNDCTYAGKKVELLKDEKPTEFLFDVPDGLLNPKQLDDAAEVLREAKIVHIGSVYSFFILSLQFPPSKDSPLRLSLEHYGRKSLLGNLDCKVRFRSLKYEEDTLMITVAPQNDMEAKAGKEWVTIPPLAFLDERGFIDKDYKGQRIKVEVTIKEKVKEEGEDSQVEKQSIAASVD